jgi:outer membrane protein, multidrug efflux system
MLDGLIQDAVKGSPDLEVARARIEEARAERAAVAAADQPQISAQSAVVRQHGSDNVPVGTPPGGLGPDKNSTLWLGGFDAAWEIDVFGGTRREVESAEATVAAAVESRRDAELSLVAEVARDYVILRTVQRRLAIAREILAIRRDTLTLVTAQFNSGLAASLDIARARVELADSEAETPALEAEERVAIYQLGVLIGVPAESLLDRLLPPRPIPEVHADVPAGLPSDLLKQRPDIRAAEHRLHAANARIGAREADLYPHFFLTGAAGLESLDAGNFLTGSSRYLAIGPSISWLVFDSGRIRDLMAAEQARTDAAAAEYHKTVLAALDEVESALITYGRKRIQRDAFKNEVAAAQEALMLAERLYEKGLQDFLTVLDAQRSLRTSELSLAGAERDCADSLIALHKALGGGWSDGRQ